VVPQAETPVFAAPATLIPAFSRQREKVQKGLRGHMRFPWLEADWSPSLTIS